MPTGQIHAVLALLDILLHNRALGRPDDAEALHLADGVALAVDRVALANFLQADLLCKRSTHDLASMAEPVIAGRDDCSPGLSRPWRVALARRLADVAAALLVAGDLQRGEAAALWGAASRLLGLDAATPAAGDRHIDNERKAPLAAEDDLSDWRAWAHGLAGATAGTDDEMRDHVGARIHDFTVEVANQERLIADMTQMIRDKDALIMRLNDDLQQAHKAATEPPKVDLHKHGGNGSARVRLVKALAPFAESQVGRLGRVIAVNNNDQRWHVQLDSGFGAWVDSDAVEVLP